MPDAAELHQFALTVADVTPNASIWPDNLVAVNVFISMTTQWRSAGYGATGLDYNVLPTVLSIKQVDKDEWEDVFESIRIMEEAALLKMAEKR